MTGPWYSKTNLESHHGLLPSAEILALQTAGMSASAYKYAKRAAEQGYDPEDAARYGYEVGTFKSRLLWQGAIMGVCSIMAIGWSYISWIFPVWAVGQLAFIAFFALRFNKVEHTPPNKRLVYPFWRRTTTVYGAAWLWPVLVIAIGAIAWIIASPMVAGHVPVDPNGLGSGPGSVQTVQTVPTTVPSQPVYTPPPTTAPVTPAYVPGGPPVANVGNGLSPGCTGDQWTGMVCH